MAGPLLPVAGLKAQLLGNLSVSKGRNVTEAEVFVGSIHGQAKRHEGEVPTAAQCASDDYAGIEPSCATSLGISFSGDRYDRFLAQFQHAFPVPEDDGATVGWMCRGGDFSPALQSLGEWLGSSLR